MDVEDIQSFLSISRKNAYALVHRKDFPKLRIGRIIKIPTKKFLEWLDNTSEPKDKKKGA